MPRYLQIITAVATASDARRIAAALVSKRLAGCVQVVGPVESTYRWKGRVERAKEWLCLVKTSHRRYNQLVTELEALHPYDTPEIFAVPVSGGARKYLAWLEAATGPVGSRNQPCP